MCCALSEQIALREVTDADYEVLRSLRADITLQHLLLANPPPEGDLDVGRWIKRRSSAGHLWVIASGSGACIGYLQLNNVHRKNRYAWLGIALTQPARGQGAGSAAIRRLCAKSEELGLRKLLLEVRADNSNAIAMYGKLGFRFVGQLRDHYDDGVSLHDVVIMERMINPAGA